MRPQRATVTLRAPVPVDPYLKALIDRVYAQPPEAVAAASLLQLIEWGKAPR